MRTELGAAVVAAGELLRRGRLEARVVGPEGEEEEVVVVVVDDEGAAEEASALLRLRVSIQRRNRPSIRRRRLQCHRSGNSRHVEDGWKEKKTLDFLKFLGGLNRVGGEIGCVIVELLLWRVWCGNLGRCDELGCLNCFGLGIRTSENPS